MGVPLHPPLLGLLVSAQLRSPVQFAPGPRGQGHITADKQGQGHSPAWLPAFGLPRAHGAEQSCPCPHPALCPGLETAGIDGQDWDPQILYSRPEHILSLQAVGTGTQRAPQPRGTAHRHDVCHTGLNYISRVTSRPCPHFPASSEQRGVFHELRPPVLGQALSFHQHHRHSDKPNENTFFLRASSGSPGFWRAASRPRGRAEFPPRSLLRFSAGRALLKAAGWGTTNVTHVCTHIYVSL